MDSCKCQVDNTVASHNVTIDNSSHDDNHIDNRRYYINIGNTKDSEEVARLQKLILTQNEAESKRTMELLALLNLKNNPEEQKKTSTVGPAVDVTQNMRHLSASAGGTRRLRSCHGTYLRAFDKGLKVDMKAGAPGTWENWWVEDRKGKVVFKAIHSPGIFLSAQGNNQLTLDYHVNASEFWKPKKNDNGSWSFQSANGTWLSAHKDGRACLQPHRQAWEEFWLEWW